MQAYQVSRSIHSLCLMRFINRRVNTRPYVRGRHDHDPTTSREYEWVTSPCSWPHVFTKHAAATCSVVQQCHTPSEGRAGVHVAPSPITQNKSPWNKSRCHRYGSCPTLGALKGVVSATGRVISIRCLECNESNSSHSWGCGAAV